MPVEHRAEGAFSKYEFEYEPGYMWLWIKWSLRKKDKDDSMIPDIVATGIAMTLDGARAKAYRKMVADREDERVFGELPKRQSGDDLARDVDSKRHADQVP